MEDFDMKYAVFTGVTGGLGGAVAQIFRRN